MRKDQLLTLVLKLDFGNNDALENAATFPRHPRRRNALSPKYRLDTWSRGHRETSTAIPLTVTVMIAPALLHACAATAQSGRGGTDRRARPHRSRYGSYG